MPEVKLAGTEAKVVIFSDIHIGQAAFNKALFERYLEYVNEIDAYVILGGDLMEFAIPVHMPQTMFDQILSVQDQIDSIEEYLMPIKDRVIYLTAGNHENRQWKKTGTDVSRNLAEKLGCFYNKEGGFVKLRVGKQLYTFSVFHGSSNGSSNIWNEPEKRWQFMPQTDLMAVGHIHHLAHKAVPKFHVDDDGNRGRRYVHFVRTGSFLTNANYALEVGYHPTLDGAPVITLDAKTHRISVDASGEAGSHV